MRRSGPGCRAAGSGTTGAGTLTTELPATRRASPCSIARRTPGARSHNGPAGRDEFGKRAVFALLWGHTVHDKRADDEPFLHALLLVERTASDERNFVKKAVNMALRAIGKRSPALDAAAVVVAQRLATSPESAARWVGKDALRELTSSAVTRRLTARRRRVTTES